MTAEGRTHTQNSKHTHTHRDKTKDLCKSELVWGGLGQNLLLSGQRPYRREIPIILLQNSEAQNVQSENPGC